MGIKQPDFIVPLQVYKHTLCDDTYLPDVVKISMRNRFLCPQFFHLVQHGVQLEPRLQVAQPAIAE